MAKADGPAAELVQEPEPADSMAPAEQQVEDGKQPPGQPAADSSGTLAEALAPR